MIHSVPLLLLPGEFFQQGGSLAVLYAEKIILIAVVYRLLFDRFRRLLDQRGGTPVDDGERFFTVHAEIGR